MCRFTLLLILATVLAAQPQTGQKVRVRLHLPADDSGLDVPGGLAKNDHNLSKYGTGIKQNQIATITLVKRSGDHTELHLNGGGFTNKEWLTLPSFDSPRWGTTKEEKRLRDSISGTRDKDRRRNLETDYNYLRAKRVKPLRDQYERELRLQRGSRLNVRIPANATPDEWSAILAPYLEPVPDKE